MPNPWEPRWKNVKNLSGGGQGLTVIVESTTGLKAVLKRIRSDATPNGRARMKGEVSNLQILASAGIKVPRVLEDNTAAFHDTGAKLYFIMDLVDGVTLDTLLSRCGQLSLSDAAKITLSLINIMALAHKQKIQHRDIKPDNIMANPDSMEAMFVDFGLSFNEDEDGAADLTKAEAIQKRFLTLPERMSSDGNKRDYRSDVCDLTGIFFYCLTGTEPRVLLNGNKPPHHATKFSELAKSEWQARELKLLFDKGFAYDSNDRFQSCSDILERINYVLKDTPAPEAPPDILGMLNSAHKHLQVKDRKAVVIRHRTTTQNKMAAIAKKIEQYQQHSEKSDLYVGYNPNPDVANPPTGEFLAHIGAYVGLRNYFHSRRLFYRVALSVDYLEGHIFKAVFHQDNQQQGNGAKIEGWTKICNFDPNDGPDINFWIEDLDQSLANEIEFVRDSVK